MAAVLVTSGTGSGPPPGVDGRRFAAAVAEDTYEVVAGLALCDPAVVVWADDGPPTALAEQVSHLTWPGTPVLAVHGPGPVRRALDALAGPDAGQAVLVAADAPDLPPLLIGKLFRALSSAEVAVCPAEDGALVALAARLPAPGWLGTLTLDDPAALAALTSARPRRGALATVPGWHRLRSPADVHRLDPGLEGWEATRALLGGGVRQE
ncbi:hypothetical protein DEF23_14255 [Marinitenerispora sediminis]|uniref:MobA-like NTP transferase domain-containing protein n=1 Tax=Marinitenerispora sediminis TaxID=1931232 RepID=A0A368T6K0_9ACTN|nr:hypothetical protein DEF28_17965 [Marinitenerispora sediminis]RCV55487.1 hypothetical protein DEF23_14255 [Marinitenerispora sediminis]RCV59119.1 hypothetical protein DEF24_10940 [Marinitenerispora sediminis]